MAHTMSTCFGLKPVRSGMVGTMDPRGFPATFRSPCPECGANVEARRAYIEGSYPGAMMLRGVQVKRGPEHEKRCPNYRAASST
jgi:hypothetical protein